MLYMYIVYQNKTNYIIVLLLLPTNATPQKLTNLCVSHGDHSIIMILTHYKEMWVTLYTCSVYFMRVEWVQITCHWCNNLFHIPIRLIQRSFSPIYQTTKPCTHANPKPKWLSSKKQQENLVVNPKHISKSTIRYQLQSQTTHVTLFNTLYFEGVMEHQSTVHSWRCTGILFGSI